MHALGHEAAMSGRVTYRHPQPPRSELIDVPPLSAATIAKLEAALGGTLDEHQREAAARAVEGAAFWRERTGSRTSPEDWRATLAALVRASDDETIAGYDASDVSTRAWLWEALCVDLGLTGAALLQPSPDAIREAAAVALRKLEAKGARGPRHTHLRLLADTAAHLWRRFGGAECAPAVKDDYATPIVKFAAALFEASGSPRSLSAVAKLLRAEWLPGK